MNNKGKINWGAWAVFVALLGVIVTFLIYYPQIRDNFPPKIPKGVPFEIQFSPNYLDEGFTDYNTKYLLSLKVIFKKGRNITYMELSEDNFKISRNDKGLTKSVASIVWDKNYNQDKLIYYNPSQDYSSSNLEIKGNLIGCTNCFIGNDYPYVFTFTIYYAEDNGDMKTETIIKEIPLL